MVVAGIGKRMTRGPGRFNSPRAFYGAFHISGVTRDSTGAALGNCTVHIYDTGTDTKQATTVSDGSGNYSVSLATNSGFFYVVAYLPGSPDVAGTTVNTVTAA